MFKVRKSAERGFADHGWLKSQHTFSFADYYDPDFTGFRTLRVINQDRVSAGQGFATHAHNNMEILSYVIEGELAHKDSMGNVKTIKAGELQAMSAGSGLTHSEYNPSAEKEVHFLQIWIIPAQKNIVPTYSEWKPAADSAAGLILLASPDARDSSLKINQDAFVSLGMLDKGSSQSVSIAPGRHVWLQIINGSMNVSNHELAAGDGVAISNESNIIINADSYVRFLMFNLN